MPTVLISLFLVCLFFFGGGGGGILIGFRDDAKTFFKRFRQLGRCPPSLMCNLLVQMLASEGRVEEAEEIFNGLPAQGVIPNEPCTSMMIRLRIQVCVWCVFFVCG